MRAGPQLAGYLRQRAEAFAVDVLHLRGAAGLAAFPGGFVGSDAAVCDVGEGWSQGQTTSRGELCGGLVVLSEVDDIGYGGLFGLCPLG